MPNNDLARGPLSRLLVIALLCAGQFTIPGVVRAQEVWRLEADLRIGAVDGPRALSNILVASLHPNGGRLYVAQPMEHAIKVFDARSGALVKSFGTRGSGPGEFNALTKLGWVGSQLTATDERMARLSKFRDDGTHVTTTRVTPVRVGEYQIVVPVRATPDGGFWAEPPNINALAVANGAIASLPVRVLDEGGRITRSISDVDVRGVVTTADYGTGGAVFDVPLTPWPFWDYDPTGESVVIVYPRGRSGSSPTFVVVRIKYNGDTIYRRDYPYVPQRVGDRDRDSIYRVYANHFMRGNTPARALQAARNHVDIPANYHPVSKLIHLSTGHVWIRREPGLGEHVDWLVLTPKGDVQASVRAPAHARLLTADSTHVWGVVLDSLDVPYLVRYRIVRQRP